MEPIVELFADRTRSIPVMAPQGNDHPSDDPLRAGAGCLTRGTAISASSDRPGSIRKIALPNTRFGESPVRLSQEIGNPFR